MRIRVLGFASVQDVFGEEEVTLELEEGATTAALEKALIAQYPMLADTWPRLAIAVDGALVPGDQQTLLSDGCEVALLPPVSGG